MTKLIAQTYYVIASIGLRVRKDHSTSALQVGTLPFGSRVSIMDTELVSQDLITGTHKMGVSLIPIGWQWVRKILVRYMLLEIHPVYKKPDLILLGRRLR